MKIMKIAAEDVAKVVAEADMAAPVVGQQQVAAACNVPTVEFPSASAAAAVAVAVPAAAEAVAVAAAMLCLLSLSFSLTH